jgi:membrane-associated protein
MDTLVDFFLHLDRHLTEFVQLYGAWVYGMFFVIVFCETGLVVTPFLPGDSLLFAGGALGGAGILSGWFVALTFVSAAILGDNVNYWIGRFVGPRVFHAEDQTSFRHRLLNRHHLHRAHAFFERYGGRSVVLGHFVPIIRTFVPFVAGAGYMTYPTFVLYNVTGCSAWVAICVGAGYAFGNVPVVKNNFSLVVVGIVAVSLTPMLVEYLRARRRNRAPDTPIEGVGRGIGGSEDRPVG